MLNLLCILSAACMQNELRGRTFSAPRKSMRGKGRVTIQFGCCYNYAVDREGRQPGEISLSSSHGSPQLLCRRLSVCEIVRFQQCTTRPSVSSLWTRLICSKGSIC